MDPMYKLFVDGLAARAAKFEQQDEGYNRLHLGKVKPFQEPGDLPKNLRNLEVVSDKVKNFDISKYLFRKEGARGGIIFNSEKLSKDVTTIIDSIERIWSSATGEEMRQNYYTPLLSMSQVFLKKIKDISEIPDSAIEKELKETMKITLTRKRTTLLQEEEIQKLEKEIEKRNKLISEIQPKIQESQRKLNLLSRQFQNVQRRIRENPGSSGPLERLDELEREKIFLEDLIAADTSDIRKIEEDINKLKNKIIEIKFAYEQIRGKIDEKDFARFTEKIVFDFTNVKENLKNDSIPELNNLIKTIKNYAQKLSEISQFQRGELKFKDLTK